MGWGGQPDQAEAWCSLGVAYYKLYLKEILINGQKILQLDGKPFHTIEGVLESGHGLSALWKRLKGLYANIGWDWEKQLDVYSEMIQEFKAVDEQSFSFRYPVKKNGDPSVEQTLRFDLKHFCQRMDELLEKLDEISCGVAGVLDVKCRQFPKQSAASALHSAR